MKNNKSIFILLLAVSFLVIACAKQSPQLPYNKGEKSIDNDAATLLEINKHLAIKEDSLIAEYVKKNGSTFKKNELGFWFKIEATTKADFIKEKELVKYDCQLSDLNGKVFSEGSKSITMGKKELIRGLEYGFKLLHKGESATFIIPWYLAYGRKGSLPTIPPYTTLMVKIKLLN